MTLPERLHDLADAIARNAASGLPLTPDDQRAISLALHSEADAMTARQRDRAMRAWTGRIAA